MPTPHTMPTTTVRQLHATLRNDPTAFVYDVREPDEFAEAHVPGATNLPLAQILAQNFPAENRPTSDARILLLCRSGKRAGVVADSLRLAGYVGASVVEGGTLAWIAEGFPVSSVNPQPASLNPS
jgi:rhodanese-related sulfurtransferase